jgi:hypothetical protein
MVILAGVRLYSRDLNDLPGIFFPTFNQNDFYYCVKISVYFWTV